MLSRLSLVSLALLALLAFASLASSASAQSCLNEAGRPVDWWVAIKLPRRSGSTFPNVANGVAYLYGDAASYAANGGRTFWRNSSYAVSDQLSAPGRTVAQIYASHGNARAGYVMYNDQTPDGDTSMSVGHTKGHMAWSAKGGFWLIHSVPRYAAAPNVTQAYAYPTSGVEYGQSMICLTLTLAGIDQAFLQMQFNNPGVYAEQWAASLTAQLPHGDALLNQGVVIKPAGTNMASITTAGGKQFTHFAKNAKWGADIFGSFIAPFYKTKMMVETWQRPFEPPLLPPASPAAVYSVLTLTPPAYAAWDAPTWKYSNDHSKWGVSVDAAASLLCIGDINKQESQWKRGGGMMCVLDKVLYNAYAQLIQTTDINGPPPSVKTMENEDEAKPNLL